jgi:Ser/Thr protein kinase RdoA (MazF antagonist)
LKNVLDVLNQFELNRSVESVRSYGNGNVNDTYMVTFEDGEGHAILQRVNTYVFSDPETVMDNMHKATLHLASCIESDGLEWQVQQVIPARNGMLYWRTPDGAFWRMISYIENSESFDTVYTHQQAYELGHALGMFHQHINRLPFDTFRTVIDGFHITPGYLKAYDLAKVSGASLLDDELNYAVNLIEEHRHVVSILEDAKEVGILPQRTIHGDPKANNVMFDKTSGKSLSMIDLDTIQPGLVHYDIGDCIRSSCNPLGEDPGTSWRDTRFDLDSFSHLIKGYLTWGRTFLTSEEYEYIYDSIFLMAFELGLRFLTDYLQGDIYYKVHFPSQNKYRALTQFRLSEDIKSKHQEINRIVKELQPL